MSTELPGLTEVPAAGLDEMTRPAPNWVDVAEVMLPDVEAGLAEQVAGTGLGRADH